MDIKLKKRIIGIMLLAAIGLLLLPLFFNRSQNMDELKLSSRIPEPPAKPTSLAVPTALKAAPEPPQTGPGARIVFEELQSTTPGTDKTVPLSPVTRIATPIPLATAKPKAPTLLAAANNKPVAPIMLTTATPAPVAEEEEAPDADDQDMTAKDEADQPPVVPAKKPSKTAAVTKKAVTKSAQKSKPAKQAKVAPSTQAWAVQLGSFSAKINADKLMKSLQSKGFTAYTQTIKSSHGTSMTKVLVGPELLREDADKLQQRLKAISANTMVVKVDS